MRRTAHRGPGIEARVVGGDPHRHALSATVVDERGGIVATGHYNVSEKGTVPSRPGH